MKEPRMNKHHNYFPRPTNQHHNSYQNNSGRLSESITRFIESNPEELFKKEIVSNLRTIARGVSSSGLRRYFQALRKLESMIRKITSHESDQRRLKEFRIEVALLAAYVNYDRSRKGSALYGKRDVADILQKIFETLLAKAEEAERNNSINLSALTRQYRKFVEILVAYGK